MALTHGAQIAGLGQVPAGQVPSCQVPVSSRSALLAEPSIHLLLLYAQECISRWSQLHAG